MLNVKESINKFIKNESTGISMIINAIFFASCFFNNISHRSFVSSFIGAAFWTIFVAAACYYVIIPLFEKFYSSKKS